MRPEAQRVVLVTGARKGLGRATVEHLLRHGWRVWGCSRGDSDLGHPDYTHRCIDVTDEAAVCGLLREISRAGNGLDALINNAGTAAMNALLLTPASSVTSVLNTNVAGTFLLMREAAKLMTRGRRGGRIVNLTSVASALDLEGEAIYAASKAAVESLTRIAARELGDYGVTVNAVGPTPVDTDLIRAVPKAKIDALIQRQAIKRLGTPEDVLNVIDFYLSPASGFVSGQVVYLGGVSG